MTSTPDEDTTDRTFARELFGSPADTEPDETPEADRPQGEDTGNPVLDPDSAGAIARRLFSHTN